MPISVRADLWQLLVLLAYGGGIAVCILVGFVVGWAVGMNRGYKTAPEAYKAEVRQARYDRDVWEARAGLAQEVAKKYETAMLELAGAVGQRPQLRAVGGRG
jgi:predicted lipid-binding transport protein (Tim44 family)